MRAQILAASFALIVGGLRTRVIYAAKRPAWVDGVHLGVLALSVAQLAMLVPYATTVPLWVGLSALAVALITLETLGGLCIALGLFTRFWAVAVFAEMMVIVYHHLPKFGWTAPGYEYPLFWGLVMLAIAMRGGGPYSLDRRIGREL